MEHEMEASGPRELCGFGLLMENQTKQKMVNEMRSWVHFVVYRGYVV